MSDTPRTEALERIRDLQPAALGYIRRNGFVMDKLGPLPDDATELDRWKVLAFSLYSDLCEVSMEAERLLDAEAAATPQVQADPPAEGLRGAVQRLVDADDIDMNCGWDSPACHFCNVETYSSKRPHANDCPWAALKRTLADTPAAKPEARR